MMGVPISATEGEQDAVQVAALREALEQRLAQLLPADGDGCAPLGHALRAATLTGGKRVRAVLMLLVARELGYGGAAVVELGCAVEMVHAASLVLDDLPCMDDATLRRGEPALHRRVGEDVATLAAVALLAQAFGAVAAADLPAATRARMTGRLASAIGTCGLVRGQFEDLHDAVRPRGAPEIAHTNHLKTGALFEAAMQLAGLAAAADERALTRLSAFARELGQAFQLCDDLRDGSAAFGKDAGQDRDKFTLVSLLGADAARLQLQTHLGRADEQLAALFGRDSAPARYLAALFAEFMPALRPLEIDTALLPLAARVPEHATGAHAHQG